MGAVAESQAAKLDFSETVTRLSILGKTEVLD